jgi:hypothetical protein
MELSQGPEQTKTSDPVQPEFRMKAGLPQVSNPSEPLFPDVFRFSINYTTARSQSRCTDSKYYLSANGSAGSIALVMA